MFLLRTIIILTHPSSLDILYASLVSPLQAAGKLVSTPLAYMLNAFEK